MSVLSAIPTPYLIAQLKRQEGFRAVPYLCTAHACTIGYGTNLQAHPQYIPYPDLECAARSGRLKGLPLRDALRARGMRWNEEQAATALHEEVNACKRQLAARCPEFVRLAEIGEIPRAEVLLNMAFNMGVDGLLRFKNTLAMLRAAISDAVAIRNAADAANGCREDHASYARVADGMLNSLWANQVGRRADELARQMRTGAYL